MPEPPVIFDDSDDEDDHHVHIAPKPAVTYGTSTHNNSHSSGFSATQDIYEYTGDFDAKVEEFDSCDEIWNQSDYEERLETEAELMVALEAIREALVVLDGDIT